MKPNSKSIKTERKKIIALAGNPNVGKSTVFNSLTGMKQHTGNWSGKTVSTAVGLCKTKKNLVFLADIPGTYSLNTHSKEEEVARDFLMYNKNDATIVVCDATSLERNLSFVLSVSEICEKVLVCVNLLDEAKRKGIEINLHLLSKELGTTVVGTVARKKKSLEKLCDSIDFILESNATSRRLLYPKHIETAIDMLLPVLNNALGVKKNNRFIALNLLAEEKDFTDSFKKNTSIDLLTGVEIDKALKNAKQYLNENNINNKDIWEAVSKAKSDTAAKIHKRCVTYKKESYSKKDRALDRIFTGRVTAFPIMLLLLCLIFFITLKGANYPSALLSRLSDKLLCLLHRLFEDMSVPSWLSGVLIDGSLKVLFLVVSVMLPPMAIFFPLFTLLEDSGYLPRIAYNLDKPFQKCNACGKQALCMCMGLGCNAAGVTGARIIDSKRERLLAIITNSFVPCNGKFPTLIVLLSVFFTASNFISDSLLTALFLAVIITSCVIFTLIFTLLLSKTFLKGERSSFTIEMPPYRRPQAARILVRSLIDRTFKVLIRAVCVAAPAGALIFILANTTVQGNSLLYYTSTFLDPLGRLFGLDGAILLGFILGLPANEIVLPIILMVYTGSTGISDFSAALLAQTLINNGWTKITALCTIVFSLFHWPCSTTLITIKKETNSLKWTLISALLPTIAGLLICFIINALASV